jgi:hypothetical protein
MSIANNEQSDDILMTEAYKQAGLPARDSWSQPNWLDFIDGWSFATLGTPLRSGQDAKFFRMGSFEASFRRKRTHEHHRSGKKGKEVSRRS